MFYCNHLLAFSNIRKHIYLVLRSKLNKSPSKIVDMPNFLWDSVDFLFLCMVWGNNTNNINASNNKNAHVSETRHYYKHLRVSVQLVLVTTLRCRYYPHPRFQNRKLSTGRFNELADGLQLAGSDAGVWTHAAWLWDTVLPLGLCGSARRGTVLLSSSGKFFHLSSRPHPFYHYQCGL